MPKRNMAHTLYRSGEWDSSDGATGALNSIALRDKSRER